jgi:hypothetical protein
MGLIWNGHCFLLCQSHLKVPKMRFLVILDALAYESLFYAFGSRAFFLDYSCYLVLHACDHCSL